MYEIIKGEPMPERLQVRKDRRRFPFAQMGVGDHFTVRDADAKLRNIVAVRASEYGRKHKQKFSVLRDGKHLKVWRVQ